MDSFFQQYDFSLPKTISNPSIAPHYRRFVKYQLNAEPAEFIEACINFCKLGGALERYEKATDIMQAHVLQGSPREVNLPANIVVATKKKFDTSTDSDCHVDLFDLAYKDQVHQLKEEWFKNFIATIPFKLEIAENLAWRTNWRQWMMEFASRKGDEPTFDALFAKYGEGTVPEVLGRCIAELRADLERNKEKQYAKTKKANTEHIKLYDAIDRNVSLDQKVLPLH
jgi:hypothetical protein